MTNRPIKPIDPDRGIIVGVTGGIASGKSTVSRLLAAKGAFTINLDEMGHELLKRGSPVMDKLIEAFGTGILDSSGDVSRQKLGAIVFNDVAARERLNAIMHPPIVRRSRSEAHRLVAEDADCVVVIDIPLLIEGGPSPSGRCYRSRNNVPREPTTAPLGARHGTEKPPVKP